MQHLSIYRDLSQTSIKKLPTLGLQDLEILKLENTFTLKEFPSVYNFKNIKEARLTYPYHCCAFKFPATHDPKEFAKYQDMFKKDMEKRFAVLLYAFARLCNLFDLFYVCQSNNNFN